MEWTAGVYGPVFDRLRTTQTKPFALRENDYVFGPLKFGGNAQSIVKDRWLHHTSFLWDFQRPNMDYLTLPERRPEYRQDRSHGSFLTRLKEHTLQRDRAALFRELEVELAQHFDVHAADEAEVRAEVIEGKLGGMVAWAENARTRDVSALEELTKHVEQLQQKYLNEKSNEKLQKYEYIKFDEI
jgi:lipoate-protein ligase A